MKIIILAAGKGSRLKPLTDIIPKCMVKVNGKPIINHIYGNILRAIQNSELYIICGYKADTLINHCKKNSIKATFIYQPKPDGTANAIFLVKEHMNEDFIVLSGDILYSVDEIEYLARIKNSILYTKMNERLYEYGTLEITGNKVKYINEKSTNPTSKLVNCGAYHFTEDVFEYIAETEIDNRFGEKIITNTINLMIEDGIKFTGIPIKYLNEISYPEDIKKVEDRI